MSNQKTFIGAYARNRRKTESLDAAAKPMSQETPSAVPPHHLDPPPRDESPNETLGFESQGFDASGSAPLAIDARAIAEETPVREAFDEASSIEQATAQDVFSQSLLISNASADTEQIWLALNQGQVLRIDAPAADPAPATDSAPATDPAPATDTQDFETHAFESQPLDPWSATVPEPETADPMQQEPPTDPAPVAPAAALWSGADWEVDAFRVSPHVVELFFNESLFRSIAEHMGQSVQAGLKTVLVTSVGPREGRSTVAIGTAIAAAATGIRVAVVDVDLEAPRQAEYLGLDLDSDWVAAIRQNAPLESVAIRSIEDNLTLIPLLDSHEDSLLASSEELDRLLDRLKGCFDLVLFDASPVDAWSTARVAAHVDSTLIVRDARSTSKADVAMAADRLQRVGVVGVGVVDNFCR